MDPKVIEITYVLRSEQSKSFLGLENMLLALADNMSLEYELALHTVTAPVDQKAELRLVLSLTEQSWDAVALRDLVDIADKSDAILLVRDITQSVFFAAIYRPSVGNNPTEEAAKQYLAKNYGTANESIFIAPYAGELKPEILEAFYRLQGDYKPIVANEPSANPEPVVFTVDLTNEETKNQIKNSLGIRNPACDLTAVTVNLKTSEVTYTIKSALWGEKEHKVVRNDLHTWPLVIKEEN